MNPTRLFTICVAFGFMSSVHGQGKTSIGLKKEAALAATTQWAAPTETATTYDDATIYIGKDGDPVKPGHAKMRQVKMGKKTYSVADQSDERRVYRENVNKDNCFIVISKQEFRLYVYEKVGKDTLLVAHYPVCLSKALGQKQRRGDMKTPECTMRNPFKITQIQPASSWKHDFGDGRGSIPSYGAWFLRLQTPGHSGIGIHGSTSNESSVPGRDSEGCIRLRDQDIKHLKEQYAKVGMSVIIQSDTEGPEQGPYAFEKRAWKAAKDFSYPIEGYTLLPGAQFVGK